VSCPAFLKATRGDIVMQSKSGACSHFSGQDVE
jgi:hypothetical protein